MRIVPGILPITQFPQVLQFAARCGASIPERLVDEFHFYTLNRAELTFAICHAIGVRPRTAKAA